MLLSLRVKRLRCQAFLAGAFSQGLLLSIRLIVNAGSVDRARLDILHLLLGSLWMRWIILLQVLLLGRSIVLCLLLARLLKALLFEVGQSLALGDFRVATSRATIANTLLSFLLLALALARDGGQSWLRLLMGRGLLLNRPSLLIVIHTSILHTATILIVAGFGQPVGQVEQVLGDSNRAQ